MLFGDASAIGLLRAIRERRAPDARTVIESPADTVDALQAWAPEMEFVAARPLPGESLHHRLWAMLQNVEAEAFFLAGHAQTIQRLRAILTTSGDVPRRAISSRAHWATGKAGP